MRRPLRVARRIACCCSLLLAVFATDAWALFVVNEPWFLPVKSGRDADVYMNLTSTEGARIIKVTTDDARRIAIRAAGKNSATMTELAFTGVKEGRAFSWQATARIDRAPANLRAWATIWY